MYRTIYTTVFLFIILFITLGVYIYRLSGLNKSLIETVDYDYASQVSTPAEAGITKKKPPSTNMRRQLKYFNIMVGGDQDRVTNHGRSDPYKALGPRYWYNTTYKCKDENDGSEQDRYILMDGLPASDRKKPTPGLMDGVYHNVNQINIKDLSNVFTTSTTPKCRKQELDLPKKSGIYVKESHYIALSDLANLSPCVFLDKINPITECECNKECEPSGFALSLSGFIDGITDYTSDSTAALASATDSMF